MKHAKKRKFGEWLNYWFGNLFLIFSIIVLIMAGMSLYHSMKTGEESHIFGYKPVYILTGSMEPTLKINGVIITKEVSELSEIDEGDIVTYHIYDEEGKKLRITHRINEIKDNGTIITKGDNNDSVDSYPLTMDNIDAKVVLIINQTAWLVTTLSTTSGKIFIGCIVFAFILFIYAIKLLFSDD